MIYIYIAIIFAITWCINIQVLPSYSNICLSATPSQNGMSRYFLWPRVCIWNQKILFLFHHRLSKWYNYHICTSHIHKLISNNIKEHRWILSSTLTLWIISTIYIHAAYDVVQAISLSNSINCAIYSFCPKVPYILFSALLWDKKTIWCVWWY